MNAAFTVEEIDIGLRALATGKSPDRNGFPAELFRYAQPPMPPGGHYSPNFLSPLIADVFTLALRKHPNPVETNLCLVTVVYKKGDAHIESHQRFIVQLLIDWAQGVNPLNFAFLDLSKAYDC